MNIDFTIHAARKWNILAGLLGIHYAFLVTYFRTDTLTPYRRSAPQSPWSSPGGKCLQCLVSLVSSWRWLCPTLTNICHLSFCASHLLKCMSKMLMWWEKTTNSGKLSNDSHSMSKLCLSASCEEISNCQEVEFIDTYETPHRPHWYSGSQNL